MFKKINNLKAQAENYSIELETIKSGLTCLKRNQIKTRIEKYNNRINISMDRFISLCKESWRIGR